MLKLLAKLIVTDYWQSEGMVATYAAFNSGVGKFMQMKATLTSSTYPERARLGLNDWGWGYEVRISEWADPPPYNNNKPGIRPNAVRFMYFREVFKNMITITYP